MSMNYTPAQVEKLLMEHSIARQAKNRTDAASLRNELLAFKQLHPEQFDEAHLAVFRREIQCTLKLPNYTADKPNNRYTG